jgi:hypothetical protein
MRQLLISILFSFLLLPVACNRTGDTGQKQQPASRQTQFGHLGDSKTGEFEGRVPFYQDGNLMVYMPLSGYPGKPLGLAYVLITRLMPGVEVRSDGGLGSADDFLQISPAQVDSKGRFFRFKYTVNIDDSGNVIHGTPPTERFSTDGQSYKPESGRVFLADLTADPPSVTQVQIDLAGVLSRPGEDPTHDELKAGVEKLAGQDKAVREFLARIDQ